MKSRLSVRNAPLRITGPLLFVAPHFDDLSLSGDAAALEVARSFGARARPVRSDVPIDVRRKARRLQAYRTQLPLLFPRRAVVDDTSLAAFLPSTERYWRIERR